jgi:hypothetical protein
MILTDGAPSYATLTKRGSDVCLSKHEHGEQNDFRRVYPEDRNGPDAR